MQQEVVKIKVKMELIQDGSSSNLADTNSDFLEPMRKAQVERLQRQIEPHQSRAMYWIVIGIVLGGLSFCLPYILEL
jgi:CHASE3 domain sensor protein